MAGGLSKSEASGPRFHVETVHVTVPRKSDCEFRVLLENEDFSKPTGFQPDVELWMPALAPSPKLLHRQSWDAYNWYEFCRRYNLELDGKSDACEWLRGFACRQQLTLTYVQGNAERNVAVAVKRYLERLECRRRWDAGWIIGGYVAPLRQEIEAVGGLWFASHKVWTMPDGSSWRHIQSMLPGDF